MRILGLVVLVTLWAGCGGDDDDVVTGDGAVRDAALTFMDARVTCTGTHAPCSAYSMSAQACVNHGCQVNGSNCQGTPHTCESFGNSLNCGQGHGCNACAYCGPGTVCVQTCIGPVLSVQTECKPSTLTCNMCSDACARALCPADSFGTDAGILSCMAQCSAPTPGAFQCQR